MRLGARHARRSFLVGALVAITLGSSAPALAEAPAEAPFEHAAMKDPAILEESIRYSRAATAADPVLQDLLDSLGFDHLHQLDPRKVYSVDRGTADVRVEDVSEEGAIGAAGTFFGLGSVVAEIRGAGDQIRGTARTVITCPLSAQTADVKGFLASTVSRDPRGGIRSGTITVDNFLTTAAQVDFAILKAAGGARNPINRTAMETTHTGSCGGEVKVQNLVSTWPPLRVELAVDDTGSMSNELAGAQAALANFIGSHNTDLDRALRGVSYELISFKDSPTLRLANTEDPGAAIAAVNSLSAGGGADCPEDALGAVSMALTRLTGDEDSAGEIVLVTDASPRSGDIGPVVAQAQSLGVPVHVMLSGDCVAGAAAAASAEAATPSARAVFERLARETGGLYFYRPGGTVEDYTEILGKIFETAASGSDREPPAVTVTATPTTVWPPNHRMVRIDTVVSAVDAKDPGPVVSLVGVTSDEPGDGQGDGATEEDVQVGADGAIHVRAERSGGGDGRVYTITYQAADRAGNVGFGSVDVTVPHHR